MKTSRQIHRMSKKDVIAEYGNLCNSFQQICDSLRDLRARKDEDKFRFEKEQEYSDKRFRELIERIIVLQNRCVSLQNANQENKQRVASAESMITALRARLATPAIPDKHSIFNRQVLQKIEALLEKPIQICLKCGDLRELDERFSSYRICERCSRSLENPWPGEPWWRKEADGEYYSEVYPSYEYVHPDGTHFSMEPELADEE